jgi:hypothetical protein
VPLIEADEPDSLWKSWNEDLDFENFFFAEKFWPKNGVFYSKYC